MVGGGSVLLCGWAVLNKHTHMRTHNFNLKCGALQMYIFELALFNRIYKLYIGILVFVESVCRIFVI